MFRVSAHGDASGVEGFGVSGFRTFGGFGRILNPLGFRQGV